MTTLLFTTHPDQALDAQLSRLDALPVLSPFSPQARDFVELITPQLLAPRDYFEGGDSQR